MNKDGYDLEHFLEREHQTNLSLLKLIEIYEERINEAIEYINKFEDIKAYYSYEEDGYEEYNYDEDFKIDLLEILEGGD